MKPEDEPTFSALDDTEAAILTIYGEARGEPFDGKCGVAVVIANRAEKWGKRVKDICLQKNQFSCYLSNDPNYPKLLKIAQDFSHELLVNSALDECSQAWRYRTPQILEKLGDSTFYRVHGTVNGWFDMAVATGKLVYVTSIEKHDFYREA